MVVSGGMQQPGLQGNCATLWVHQQALTLKSNSHFLINKIGAYPPCSMQLSLPTQSPLSALPLGLLGVHHRGHEDLQLGVTVVTFLLLTTQQSAKNSNSEVTSWGVMGLW